MLCDDHRNLKNRHLHWTVRTRDFGENTSVRAQVDCTGGRGGSVDKTVVSQEDVVMSGKVGTTTRMRFYGH